MRGPTHRNIIDQAARKAMGRELPWDCKIVNVKPKKLPGRSAGTEARIMCDVATIYTTAQRNPKRAKRKYGKRNG